jgi:hypothetical protein
MTHAVQDIENATRTDVAALFNVHPSTISRWVARDGCPRNPSGTFDLRKVILWRLDDGDLESVSCEDEQATKWLTEFRKERALLAQIERKRAEGRLWPVKEIERQWNGRILLVTAGLTALAYRLPPILAGKDRNEMRAIIKAEVRELRNNYAEVGRYCHDDGLLERIVDCLSNDGGGQNDLKN